MHSFLPTVAIIAICIAIIAGCDFTASADLSSPGSETTAPPGATESDPEDDTQPEDSTGTSSPDDEQSDDADGTDDNVCPEFMPEHLPLEEGDVFTYEYSMKASGGMASGEDRGYGTTSWVVESGPACVGNRLQARITESSTIITEYRALAGEDQSWHRRDSVSTSGWISVRYDGSLDLSKYAVEPIPLDEMDIAQDTINVTWGGAYESSSITLVRGVGIVNIRQWQRHGLGGPSESREWKLVQ